MSTMLDSSTEVEVHQTEEANQANPQTDVVAKKDYIELQSVATKDRMARIEAETELSRVNPKRILDISDKKVQDKVIKELYGLDNLSELQLINGTDFWKSVTETDEDEVTTLKKKVAVIEYRSKNSEVDNAIEKFVLSNKELFTDNESEKKLRESFGLLSNDVELVTRIKLAAKIAIGYDDSRQAVNDAYRTLATSQGKEGSGGEEQKAEKETSIAQRQAALRDFLKN